uniref:Uncharacterized protein n=1 Tax=Nelumbo nucifera TaxID=4432 RepID=A0A822ZIX6_NELNU|nr:TPA_asm: hypothetical protein HUJ06_003322 [Nelumbo nucifera]
MAGIFRNRGRVVGLDAGVTDHQTQKEINKWGTAGSHLFSWFGLGIARLSFQSKRY